MKPILICSLILIPAAPPLDSGLKPGQRPGPYAAIVCTGVLGSALPSLCHFTVIQRAGAINASLVTLIMPVTPILLGGVFLGERLSATDIAGALVIAAALIIIDGRPLDAVRRAARGF